MRVVAFCLVMLSTVAVFAVLVYLQDILIPFTFAFFLTCVLEPVQRLVIHPFVTATNGHAAMVVVRTLERVMGQRAPSLILPSC